MFLDSLELQPGFACTGRHCRTSPVVLVTSVVEDHLLDALFQALLATSAPTSLARSAFFAVDLCERTAFFSAFLGRRSEAATRSSRHVVDDLDVDVLGAPEHHHAGAFRSLPLDALAERPVPLLASLGFVLRAIVVLRTDLAG